MKYRQLFGKTLRAAPQEIRARSLELLLRGGYVRSLGQGLFSFLPLGYRVMLNLCRIIRDELESIGGQEVFLPVVNPAELWERSGRTDLLGPDLVRFQDRTGRGLVLAASHEEAMVELLRSTMSSYREFPIFLFQFQEKFRDEERTRGGLIRSKEFMMKDAYSFHRSATDLNNFFPKVFAAYERIFKRCGIRTVTAEAGVGYMAGEKAYEFQMPATDGETLVLSCPQCGYRADREVARGLRCGTAVPPSDSSESPGELRRVRTPHCETVEQLARYLSIDRRKIAKSLIYKLYDGYVMAVVRGDHDVNTEKLSAVVKRPVVGLAAEEELAAMGLTAGYLSPIGLGDRVPLVVDELVAGEPNLVFGANEDGVHVVDGNFGRDYVCETVADITEIRAGDCCFRCGAPLEEMSGVELGHLFKLGDYYSRSMNLTFQEENGEKAFPHMGSYGIGVGRLVASIVEANNDEKGIIWPPEIAPYRAYLMTIGKSFSVARMAEEIHQAAPELVLFDDRDDSPGVKFQDADLLGLPLRIVISPKHLADGMVELRERRTGAVRTVAAREVPRELGRRGPEVTTHAL